MTPERHVDYILSDCFFAVGQAVGAGKRVDVDALAWWRARYRDKFLYAITVTGNSWMDDRARVMAVGRYLGQRASHYAGDNAIIDLACATKASAEIEAGCTMSKLRETAVVERKLLDQSRSFMLNEI